MAAAADARKHLVVEAATTAMAILTALQTTQTRHQLTAAALGGDARVASPLPEASVDAAVAHVTTVTTEKRRTATSEARGA